MIFELLAYGRMMRLKSEQVEAIKQTILPVAGEHARIILFGSRRDDTARGGDVDLLVESERPLTLLDGARLKVRLERRLGLPVDLLCRQPYDEPGPFEQMILQTGVVL